jgi:Hypervirulence associated proteins TUDOR domain
MEKNLDNLFKIPLARYADGMAKEPKAGDKVRWNTSQGMTHGKVKRKLTSETTVGGQKIAASPESPRYLVVSDKTGAEAAHKPEALERT